MSLERAIAGGRRGGPSAVTEFIRTDLAPRMTAPSSHFFPTSTPALRSASSSDDRFAGALLEMWWTLTPVEAVLAASFSSHLRPDGVDGSKVPGPPSGRRVYMLSSVTSPMSPEKMSMCVTPGKCSFVHCGKSSMVISPYFFFSSCVAGLPPPPPRPPARLLKIERIG